MNVEKEIQRLKADVKELYGLIKEKRKRPKFACFLNEYRSCDWHCPAHSDHEGMKLKHGWKAFKKHVLTKGYCKIIKAVEEGKAPDKMFDLIKK